MLQFEAFSPFNVGTPLHTCGWENAKERILSLQPLLAEAILLFICHSLRPQTVASGANPILTATQNWLITSIFLSFRWVYLETFWSQTNLMELTDEPNKWCQGQLSNPIFNESVIQNTKTERIQHSMSPFLRCGIIVYWRGGLHLQRLRANRPIQLD